MKPEQDKEFLRRVQEKRIARMDRIDSMTPEQRKLVHEYGLTVVVTCMDLGVRKPSHIRHLVERILDEFSPTRGSYSVQGLRKNIETGMVMKKGPPVS